ncbi:MAG: hypothetical protein AAGL08_21080, partial [Cyanobacteria bacterium J06573_11]
CDLKQLTKGKIMAEQNVQISRNSLIFSRCTLQMRLGETLPAQDREYLEEVIELLRALERQVAEQQS